MRPFLLPALLLLSAATAVGQTEPLRVCADPGHEPFITRKGTGFENRILEVLGRRLGASVEYHWILYQSGSHLLRNAMADGACDIGVGFARPPERATVLSKPYYRSTYVLAYRKGTEPAPRTQADLLRRRMRVGVHSGTAPQFVLERMGVRDVIAIYYPFPTLTPPGTPYTLIEDLLKGKLDAAVVWGPVAGYAVAKRGAPLELAPLPELRSAEDSVSLVYDIRFAVAQRRPELRQLLDRAIDDADDEIAAILTEFGVPAAPSGGQSR